MASRPAIAADFGCVSSLVSLTAPAAPADQINATMMHRCIVSAPMGIEAIVIRGHLPERLLLVRQDDAREHRLWTKLKLEGEQEGERRCEPWPCGRLSRFVFEVRLENKESHFGTLTTYFNLFNTASYPFKVLLLAHVDSSA